MARMNKSASITGRPRTRKANTHAAGVASARANGLAAWCVAHGWTNAKGEPLVFSASQRRAAERAMERATTPASTPAG
jgi:hypothetical protein